MTPSENPPPCDYGCTAAVTHDYDEILRSAGSGVHHVTIGHLCAACPQRYAISAPNLRPTGYSFTTLPAESPAYAPPKDKWRRSGHGNALHQKPRSGLA